MPQVLYHCINILNILVSGPRNEKHDVHTCRKDWALLKNRERERKKKNNNKSNQSSVVFQPLCVILLHPTKILHNFSSYLFCLNTRRCSKYSIRIFLNILLCNTKQTWGTETTGSKDKSKRLGYGMTGLVFTLLSLQPEGTVTQYW